MGNAIARRADQQMLAPSDGVRLFSETEAREQFHALILPFTPRQLSRFSGVTPESARHWISGVRGPNVASLFNVARSLPSVQGWAADRMGMSRAAQCLSIDEIERALHALAARDDEEGRIARQLLIACYTIHAGSNETVPPIVRLAWDAIEHKVRG